MKFQLVIPVWGKKHTNLFISETLPSLYSPGNLINRHRDAELSLELYTTEEDRETIERCNIYHEISKIVKCNFSIFSKHSIAEHNSYRLMTRCHREAIKRSDWSLPLILLGADSVCSDGLIQQLIDLAFSGYRTVLAPIIRMNREEFSPKINLHIQNNNLKYRSLPPRELTKIAMESLHPYANRSLINSEESVNQNLTHLYWKIEGGLLVRCLHLHPFLLWPEKKGPLPPRASTFDDQYIKISCPSVGKWKFITDSDEFVAYEATEPDDANSPLMQNNIENLRTSVQAAEMRNYNCFQFKQLNGFFLRRKFFFHSTPPSLDWIRISNQSDETIDQILDYNDSTYRFLKKIQSGFKSWLKEQYQRHYKREVTFT